jgi:hypothetical protein
MLRSMLPADIQINDTIAFLTGRSTCSRPDPVAPDSISGVVPFVVATVAKSLGADPEALLRGSGVDAASPPPGDEHVEIARYFEGWRRAMALLDVTFPYLVGFTEPPAFFKAFKRWIGMTPRELQAGARP